MNPIQIKLPTQLELLKLFKSYQWNNLFEIVKDVEYDLNIPIETQYLLALKAALLIGWWSDNNSAIEILEKYPLVISDPFTHFMVTYGYVCLANIKMANHYRNNFPKETQIWMKQYIELEYRGQTPFRE